MKNRYRKDTKAERYLQRAYTKKRHVIATIVSNAKHFMVHPEYRPGNYKF